MEVPALFISLLAVFRFTSSVNFGGGTMSYSFLQDGKVKIDLLEGFALGEGPCGPTCSISDVGKDTKASRHMEISKHGNDWARFGEWKMERKIHGTSSVINISSKVEQDKRETVIAVSETDKWEQERTVVEISPPPSSSKFDVYFDGNSWRNLDYQGVKNSAWHLQIQISKGRRNDTNMPNRSPISLAKPVYKLSLNKKHVIKLPYTDPDQDKVECHMAKFVETTLNKDLTHTDLSEDCVLTIEPKTSYGYRDNTWGCVQIVMRDYNTKTIKIETGGSSQTFAGNGKRSLSAIPIQFLVQFINASGEPIFVKPTVDAQHLFEIFSGATFSTDVYAQPNLTDTTREISEFIATSRNGEIFHIKTPLQSADHWGKKVKTTSISWTTTDGDIGGHIVCIRVQDNKGLESVDQRCYTIRVHDSHLLKLENSTNGPEIVAIPDSTKLKCLVNSTCSIPIYAKQHGLGVIDKFMITRQSGNCTVGPVLYVPNNPVGPYIGNVFLNTKDQGIHLVCLKAVDNFTAESEEKCLHFNVQPNDPCFDIPCGTGGTCKAIGSIYKCTCNKYFKGLQCDKAIDPCTEHHPCQNGGTCQTRTFIQYSCTCPSGFTGHNCGINIDDCRNWTCSNHGQCIDKVNDRECQCFPGYTGAHCETDTNECHPNPCKNGGICTDMINGFRCTCKSGNTGAVCDGRKPPCQNVKKWRCIHGVCENINLTTAVCHCFVGYDGAHCRVPIDQLTGIQAHFAQPTPHNGGILHCLSTQPCILPIHYTTGSSGSKPKLDMRPVPPEVNVTHGKSVPDPSISNKYNTNVTISNFKPGVKKFCLKLTDSNGTVDDHVCYKVVTHPPKGHLNTSKPHFLSPTLPDGSKLLCTAGRTCHIPVITTANGSSCVPVISGVVQGLYIFSPVHKTSSGMCKSDVSFKPSLPQVGTQKKVCLEVSSHEEKRCFEIEVVNKTDPCLNVTCHNGGNCMRLDNTNTECICASGFTGKLCETNINDCVLNSCQNGATCVDSINSYTCKCRNGFTGKYCETNINECNSHPCQNGGFCKDEIDGYKCICRSEFNGTNCENRIDPCKSSKCQNGVCETVNKTGTICHCYVGYKGTDCNGLTDTATGPKAHFVEPSPGNGGTISCLTTQPCTVPIHYVTGMNGTQPDLEVTPIPSQFNATTGVAIPDRKITDKYQKNVVIHESKPGVKKFCLQLTNNGDRAYNYFRKPKAREDSVCYTVISRPPTIIPDKSKTHFLDPTLNNNSTLPCLAGTVCHIPVVTTASGNSCIAVNSSAAHELYVFPIQFRNGTCVTDVTFKPKTTEVGTHHNICIKASAIGEQRCFTLNVVNKTDPCASMLCVNGGACLRHEDNKPECVCPQGFAGNHCANRTDPCYNLHCHHHGECKVMNRTGAVCHCRVGFGALDCSNETDKPTGSKAHFVQPSPGNGGVINCSPLKHCTIPLHYVVGTSGIIPHFVIKPVPPGINVTAGIPTPHFNNNDTYRNDVVISAIQNVTGKFCIQLTNNTGGVDDSVCYKVVSKSSPNYPDQSKPHFQAPTLQNNSIVPCKLGTTCHIPVITTSNGSSCVHIKSSATIHGLYVFSPLSDKNGTCTTDVSYTPDPSQVGGVPQNICIQAGPDGEDRCFGIDVVNITDPCKLVKCENGGACFRTGDNTTECVCQEGYTGKHCENRKDPCASLHCSHNGECETISQTIGICHCRIGYKGANCSVETNLSNGTKAHFVQPSPGNGGIITCLPKQLCRIPLYYVTGSSGKQPGFSIRPKPPDLNVVPSNLTTQPINNHTFGKDVTIHGFKNGTKKFCIQLTNNKKNVEDSVCYTVVSKPPIGHLDLSKPHFVSPTLQNNSVIPCTLGTTCHVHVVTITNGSSCVHVESPVLPGLYVFSPITRTNGQCFTDVSYKPNPSLVGSKQNICIQAAPDGETRCFGIYVFNKTDPCLAIDCKNGGACMRQQTTGECICENGFSGAHCTNTTAMMTSVKTTLPSRSLTQTHPTTRIGNTNSTQQQVFTTTPTKTLKSTSHATVMSTGSTKVPSGSMTVKTSPNGGSNSIKMTGKTTKSTLKSKSLSMSSHTTAVNIDVSSTTSSTTPKPLSISSQTAVVNTVVSSTLSSPTHKSSSIPSQQTAVNTHVSSTNSSPATKSSSISSQTTAVNTHVSSTNSSPATKSSSISSQTTAVNTHLSSTNSSPATKSSSISSQTTAVNNHVSSTISSPSTTSSSISSQTTAVNNHVSSTISSPSTTSSSISSQTTAVNNHVSSTISSPTTTSSSFSSQTTAVNTHVSSMTSSPTAKSSSISNHTAAANIGVSSTTSSLSSPTSTGTNETCTPREERLYAQEAIRKRRVICTCTYMLNGQSVTRTLISRRKSSANLWKAAGIGAGCSFGLTGIAGFIYLIVIWFKGRKSKTLYISHRKWNDRAPKY